MVEKVIVIVLVVAAAVGWVLYIRKESKHSCEGCADCSLRGQCKHIKK